MAKLIRVIEYMTISNAANHLEIIYYCAGILMEMDGMADSSKLMEKLFAKIFALEKNQNRPYKLLINQIQVCGNFIQEYINIRL